MTPDEMERTMQFILQQQAQFQEDIRQLDKRHGEQQAQFQEDIRQLDKRHGELQGAVITITGVVGRLGEAQIHTEERLSAFITFVERYISEAGRN